MPTASSLPGIPPIESPLFEQIFADGSRSPEVLDLARRLRRDGFAVLRFPDETFDERAERIKTRLAGVDGRRQDAWKSDDDVRAIAVNPGILELLSILYGRRPIPFQTLNFPVGTQQHFHSDAVHFSSVPERFMCGVWVALEDIHPGAGPLEYYPGTHAWPICSYEQIGRHYDHGDPASQETYHDAWADMVRAAGVEKQLFMARKGDALIWCANLLHGGSRREDRRRTRWSQVTHYYFEDCAYYTPMMSDPFRGIIAFRDIVDIGTGQVVPNRINGAPVPEAYLRAARGQGIVAAGRRSAPLAFRALGRLLGRS